MQNPEITVVPVTDVPTLVFSGCGSVSLATVISNTPVVYGGPDLSFSGSNTQFSGVQRTFSANAQIYAVCPPGATNTVKVTRWF